MRCGPADETHRAARAAHGQSPRRQVTCHPHDSPAGAGISWESAGREYRRDPDQVLNAHHPAWTKTQALSSLASSATPPTACTSCAPRQAGRAAAGRRGCVRCVVAIWPLQYARPRYVDRCPPMPACHSTSDRVARGSVIDGRPRSDAVPVATVGRIGVGRDGGIAPGPPQAASTIPHRNRRRCPKRSPNRPARSRISWFSGVYGRRDIRVAAPARVLRPAMRGAAEQVICPVAGPTQVRRY